jgi:hypothetical protein
MRPVRLSTTKPEVPKKSAVVPLTPALLATTLTPVLFLSAVFVTGLSNNSVVGLCAFGSAFLAGWLLWTKLPPSLPPPLGPAQVQDGALLGVDGLLLDGEPFIAMSDLDSINTLRDRCVIVTRDRRRIELFGWPEDLARVKALSREMRARLAASADHGDGAPEVLLARVEASTDAKGAYRSASVDAAGTNAVLADPSAAATTRIAAAGILLRSSSDEARLRIADVLDTTANPELRDGLKEAVGRHLR